MKIALLVLGFVAVGVAVADLATGNNEHQLLPEFIGGNLTQQTDLLLGAAGAGLLFFAYTQL